VTVQGAAIEAGALAFLTAAVATGAARWVAIRRGLVDRPRADRIHASATPYLGGVAIAGGTLAAFAAFARLGDPQVLVLVLAAAAISCVGLADDLRPLSPAIRLIAECLAATALVATGVHMDVFARLPVLGQSIDDAGTVAWIVIITNSFNLLDNTDGAAAAIALVTSPILAVLALATGQLELAILLLALSAGCAGFLVHNWPPARIFMGDAGSLFLGFVLSAAIVLTCVTTGTAAAAPVTAVSGGLLLMFVAMVDTGTVLLSRHRAGRRWTEGGRDHIAHRLRAAGLSTSLTALALTLAAAITGALGLLVISGSIPARGVLAATLAVGGTLVVVAQKVQVYGPAIPAERAGLSGAILPNRAG
jgi:UDP-GlcNAc:undecaprenyl-phosphate GlcNAc-1-phosphate transferase